MVGPVVVVDAILVAQVGGNSIRTQTLSNSHAHGGVGDVLVRWTGALNRLDDESRRGVYDSSVGII